MDGPWVDLFQNCPTALPCQHAHLPSGRGFFTPKIVGTFYMQGYKVKEKTTIVPHCTPSFKTQWAPLPAFKMAAVTKDRNFFNCSLLL
jgi:hypothetical protein